MFVRCAWPPGTKLTYAYIYTCIYIVYIYIIYTATQKFMRFGPKRPFKNVYKFYLCVTIYTILFYSVYINYENYICEIFVLFAYSHKYSAHINNWLYDIYNIYLI